jgi:hypothetical protein
MVPEEEEAAGVTGLAEVNHHHAVLGRLHECLDVTTHDDSLLVGQVTDEH